MFNVCCPSGLAALQTLHQDDQDQREAVVQIFAAFSAQRTECRAIRRVADPNIRIQQKTDGKTQQPLCVSSNQRFSAKTGGGFEEAVLTYTAA